MDVKNFYLNTPLAYFQYMRLQLSLLPDEIITHYKLKDIADDGYIYYDTQGGMYGLAEAGVFPKNYYHHVLSGRAITSANLHQVYGVTHGVLSPLHSLWTILVSSLKENSTPTISRSA